LERKYVTSSKNRKDSELDGAIAKDQTRTEAGAVLITGDSKRRSGEEKGSKRLLRQVILEG